MASLESRGWETESAVGKLSGKSSWRKRTHVDSGRAGRELGTGTPKLRKAGVEVNLETGGSPGLLPDKPPQGISTSSLECPASFSEGEGRGQT